MGIFNMIEVAEQQKPESSNQNDPVKTVDAAKVSETENVIKTKEDTVITLNGNLSQIYTDALNQMYATEHMGAMFNIINGIAKANEGSDDLYVHIIDQDELDTKDPVVISDELRIALDKRTETKKIVVLESNNQVATLIGSILKQKGIDCLHDRNTALGTIRNCLG